MILFNDFKALYQRYSSELHEAVSRVMQSGWYLFGRELETFEQLFADYIGVRYCVGVASGTDAITLSLMALDIGTGDEVITSNVTAFPTITGIIQAGAKPIVVDIDETTGLIDNSKIKAKITPRTRAIIPVHLYGQSCDLNRLNAIARTYNLAIVEDCAQAAGTIYQGKRVGSFGTCAAFSFYPTKNLGACGDAGAVTTNSEKLWQRLRMIRNYGQCVPNHHTIHGINSRMDEIQAAILRVKLKYLEEWNKKRRELAKLYQENLSTAMPLAKKDYGVPNYHLFVVKHKNREGLRNHLQENDIQSLIHYPIPIHKQEAFPNQKDEKMVVSEKFTQSIVSLPLHPELSTQDIERIIHTVNSFSG